MKILLRGISRLISISVILVFFYFLGSLAIRYNNTKQAKAESTHPGTLVDNEQGK